MYNLQINEGVGEYTNARHAVVSGASDAWHVQRLSSLRINESVVERLLLDLPLLDSLQRLRNLLGSRGSDSSRSLITLCALFTLFFLIVVEHSTLLHSSTADAELLAADLAAGGGRTAGIPWHHDVLDLLPLLPASGCGGELGALWHLNVAHSLLLSVALNRGGLCILHRQILYLLHLLGSHCLLRKQFLLQNTPNNTHTIPLR